jgi:hypothetical protein
MRVTATPSAFLVNNSNQTAATVRGIMDRIAVALIASGAPVRNETRRVPLSGQAARSGSR